MTSTNQSNPARSNQFIFIGDKTNAIYEECFRHCCTKKGQDFSSLTNKQVSCIQLCTSKLYNAYSFMYQVVLDQGIQRGTQTQFKQNMIV